MKVITLHQPWASLIAMGVKTIETRSWPTSHRGRIAIHAAATKVPLAVLHKAEALGRMTADETAIWRALHTADPDLSPIDDLPFGAIVATAEVVDVVPMVATPSSVHHDRSVLDVRRTAFGPRMELLFHPGGRCRRVDDQLPFGDFAPGRWAWLLDDVEPLERVVRFRGGQGLTRSWEPGADG